AASCRTRLCRSRSPREMRPMVSVARVPSPSAMAYTRLLSARLRRTAPSAILSTHPMVLLRACSRSRASVMRSAPSPSASPKPNLRAPGANLRTPDTDTDTETAADTLCAQRVKPHRHLRVPIKAGARERLRHSLLGEQWGHPGHVRCSRSIELAAPLFVRQAREVGGDLLVVGKRHARVSAGSLAGIDRRHHQAGK